MRREVARPADKIDSAATRGARQPGGRGPEEVGRGRAQRHGRGDQAASKVTKQATDQAGQDRQGGTTATKAAKATAGGDQGRQGRQQQAEQDGRPGHRRRQAAVPAQGHQEGHAAKKARPQEAGPKKDKAEKAQAHGRGGAEEDRAKKPPAEQRAPPPARHRARAPGPRRQPPGGPGGHRRRRACSWPARRPTSRPAWSRPTSRWSLLGPPSPFVSRGGAEARCRPDRFAVAVAGRRALDAGASTGGFTDCLLQRGAAHVYAVDVGHGQLDPRLRADPRVDRARAGERPHARRGRAARRPTRRFVPCPLVVADLSFISLRTVVPALSGPVAAAGADLVLLVKPQFEAGRAAVLEGQGRGARPGLWLGALEGVASALADAGTGIMGAMASPLTGAAGNVEFLVHARKGCGARRGRGRRPVRRRPVGGGRTRPRAGRLSAPARPWRPSPSSSTPTAPTRWRWPPTRRPGSPSAGDTARILRFSGPDRVERGRASSATSAGRPGRHDGGGEPGRRRHLPARRAPGHGGRRARAGRELRPAGLPARPRARTRSARRWPRCFEGKATIEERCALEVTIADRSVGDARRRRSWPSTRW